MDHDGGNSYRDRSRRYVCENNCIGADSCASAENDTSQDFGAGAYFHPGAEARRRPTLAPGANGHLLEQQTVRADYCLGMNDDPIGVWQQQSATQAAIERNIGSGDHAPESVPEGEMRTDKSTNQVASLMPVLVASDCAKKSARRVPEPITALA